jgi:mannose-6-phosphate isomerase-like protein (cupin superfamily)
MGQQMGVSMANLTTTLTVSTLTLMACLLLPAAAQHTAPPPAPTPGSTGIFIAGQQLADQLKAAMASGTDPAVAEVGVSDQYAIHEVHRSKPAPAAVHMGWTEVHLILDGAGTLVTGGKMTNAPGGGNTIEGGVSHPLKKGDVFIIPANTPHMYQQVDGTLSYFEMRFIAPPPANAPK